MNFIQEVQPKFTALVWVQSPAGWVWIEEGTPIAFFNNPHDYINNIRIADPEHNENLWREIEKSLDKYFTYSK